MDRIPKRKSILNCISVVVPNYDDPRIEDTLQSIVSQNTHQYELIVIEGCVENTNTASIYKEYNDQIDIFIHETDDGIFDALSKGIKRATGDFIYLIGADDKLSDNECFQSVLKIVEEKPEVDGVCIGCKFSKDGEYIREWNIKSITSQKMKWGILPPHFSLFLNNSVYQEIGLFEVEDTQVAADTEWLLRLASDRDVKIPIVNRHYVNMELGGTSTGSLKYILKSVIVIAKAAKRHGIKQWPLTPIIKILSKFPQFNIRKYLKNWF